VRQFKDSRRLTIGWHATDGGLSSQATKDSGRRRGEAEARKKAKRVADAERWMASLLRSKAIGNACGKRSRSGGA